MTSSYFHNFRPAKCSHCNKEIEIQEGVELKACPNCWAYNSLVFIHEGGSRA